ncbi:MAG TPA: response regulator [Anaerolineales bacterium]|nr:response regulator [Anaerolineales bacterium]
MTRVIIADPDPKSRNAFFLWLVYKLGIDEIIQASDGERLMEHLKQDIPDVVLMDWSLPDRPAPEFCKKLQERHPGLRWIILSIDAEVSIQAMSYSRWFLQKGSSPEKVFLLLQELIK